MKSKIFTAFITLVCAVLFLAGNASAGFASNESGISAYVNVGKAIDLNQAAGAYKLIEDKTSTYVIGTVWVPNSTVYELPHIFTSADGWIMAYYPKEQVRSMIMQWGQYDPNNPTLSQMNTTRLEDAISNVSSAVGVDYSTIKSNTKYYDFQYPDANRLTIIAQSRATNGIGSFKFRIPSEYNLSDASWAYYSYNSLGCGYYGCNSWFNLDNNRLSGTDGQFNHNSESGGCTGCAERYYGTINALTKDVLHRGDLGYTMATPTGGSSNIAIFLIYKEP